MATDRILTPLQVSLLATLRKRGAEFTAEAAERHWRNGEAYYLDTRNGARKGLVRDFERANRQAREVV